MAQETMKMAVIRGILGHCPLVEIEGVRDFSERQGKEGTLIVVYEQERKLSMVGRMSSLGRTWNTFTL